jgi:hypothetical protein
VNRPNIDGKDGVGGRFRRGLHLKAAAQAGSSARPAASPVAHQVTFALCTISQNRRSWALRFRQAM